jgi:hypothetical protein
MDCRKCGKPIEEPGRGPLTRYHFDCRPHHPVSERYRLPPGKQRLGLRVTPVMIPRTCLHCRTRFLARHPAALYCGLDCFVTQNCHYKPSKDDRAINQRARQAVT